MGFRGVFRFLIRSINDSNSPSELSDCNSALCRGGVADVLFPVLPSQLLSALPARKPTLPLAANSSPLCGGGTFRHFQLSFRSFTPPCRCSCQGLSTNTESSVSLRASGYCSSLQQAFSFSEVVSFFGVRRSFGAVIQKKLLKVLARQVSDSALALKEFLKDRKTEDRVCSAFITCCTSLKDVNSWKLNCDLLFFQYICHQAWQSCQMQIASLSIIFIPANKLHIRI